MKLFEISKEAFRKTISSFKKIDDVLGLTIRIGVGTTIKTHADFFRCLSKITYLIVGMNVLEITLLSACKERKQNESREKRSYTCLIGINPLKLKDRLSYDKS